MPGARVCLLLAVFSALSLVALSSPDGDVQDLGEDVGRRAGRRLIRRMIQTSGSFNVGGGGGHRRAGFQGNHEEDEPGEAAELSDVALVRLMRSCRGDRSGCRVTLSRTGL